HEHGAQAFAEAFAGGQIDAALVEDDAGAGVAAAQGDHPGPPAEADEMVGGGEADGLGAVGPGGKLLGEFGGVPVFDAAPAGPDGGGGVVGVGLEPALLAGEQRGEAGGVDDPAGVQ